MHLKWAWGLPAPGSCWRVCSEVYPPAAAVWLISWLISVHAQLSSQQIREICYKLWDPPTHNSVSNSLSVPELWHLYPHPRKMPLFAWLHSSHTLVKWCSKFSKPGFSNTWTMNFQLFKLVLQKAEEPEIKMPTSLGSWKKQESSRKTSTSALLTTPKSLTVWITTNWKNLKEMGIPDHMTCWGHAQIEWTSASSQVWSGRLPW